MGTPARLTGPHRARLTAPDLSGSESFYGVSLKQHSDVSVVDVSGKKKKNPKRFIKLESHVHSLIVEIQLKMIVLVYLITLVLEANLVDSSIST